MSSPLHENNQPEKNAWTKVGAALAGNPNGRGGRPAHPVRSSSKTTSSSRNTKLTIQILQKPSSTVTPPLARTGGGLGGIVGVGGGNHSNTSNAVVAGTHSARKQASSSSASERRQQPVPQRPRNNGSYKSNTNTITNNNNSTPNRVKGVPQINPTPNATSVSDDTYVSPKWNTLPPKATMKTLQTSPSLPVSSHPHHSTNGTSATIPFKQPHKPKGPKTTSSTTIPMQTPPKPKGSSTTSGIAIPLQQQHIPKGTKATSAALNKLLQPKKEAAVHTIDAHHSAAMLSFFGTTTPVPSALHNSNVATPVHQSQGKHGAGASPSTAVLNPSVGVPQTQSSLFFGKDIKGRQRVRPRIKKFTALKKKVLEERLRKWNEAQAATSSTTESTERTTSCPATTTVCLWGFCNVDELDDAEEYEEILDNLRVMATKLEDSVSGTPNVFLPRTMSPLMHGPSATDLLSEGCWPTWVQFTHSTAVEAAVASWNGLVVGGQTLRCHAVPLPRPTPADSPTALETEKIDTTSTNHADIMTDVDAILQWQSQCWAQLIANSNFAAIDVDAPAVISDSADSSAFTILIENAITQDDLDDEDCLVESLQDLRALCSNYGTIETLDLESNSEQPLAPELPRLQVTFASGDPQLVLAKLNAISVGGQQFVAILVSMTRDVFHLHLRNVLTVEDFEDDDCLQESLNDVRELAQKFGQAVNVVVEKPDGESIEIVRVDYPTLEEAECAVTGFNDTIFGGNMVSASLVADRRESIPKSLTTSSDVFYVRLQNVLTLDDLEDHDCLEESLNDVRELAQKYGLVTSVVVEKLDDGASINVVRVDYFTFDEAQTAAAGLNGTTIGGSTVSASLVTVGRENPPSSTTDAILPSSVEPPKGLGTMFSGDKIISERFAECKRVPKIANSQAAPRPYATLATSLSATDAAMIKTLLVEMLGELARLQKRAVEDKNAKARRRLVMGLREVARGVRAHKVKMVVMASNLDEYGIIDQTLQDIIELCKTEEVPIFYEFTKRALGKALGKTIKVAVAGIQNADGAHQQYKAIMKYALQL